jgi:hypothetical protein
MVGNCLEISETSQVINIWRVSFCNKQSFLNERDGNHFLYSWPKKPAKFAAFRPRPLEILNFNNPETFRYLESYTAMSTSFKTMKKIDILNFITNFRKSPNDIKTHNQLVAHLGAANEQTLNQLLAELLQLRVVKQVEVNGEKGYQVTTK